MISICMIVKNEEKSLKQCLEAIKPLECEIVVVDTGSTDATKMIATQYTDHVYDYEWTKDFAAARNYSISKASNEYVLVIDADEIVTSFDKEQILKQIKEFPTQIGRLLRVNEYHRDGQAFRYTERVNRLFSKQYYRYEGRIHEQLVSISGKDYATYPIACEMLHSGYEGNLEDRKKKTSRNIELLETACLDHPEDPYLIYQLGKSYYMQEDYVSACKYFQKALEFDLDIHLEYVIDMVESYGYSLLDTKQYEQALELEGVYHEFSHSSDFVFLMGLIYLNNARFMDAIQQFEIATSMSNSKMEGCNSYLAYYNIGVIYECLSYNEQAIRFYQMCGDYPKALERMDVIQNKN